MVDVFGVWVAITAPALVIFRIAGVKEYAVLSASFVGAFWTAVLFWLHA